jgi:hypothetical protein
MDAKTIATIAACFPNFIHVIHRSVGLNPASDMARSGAANVRGQTEQSFIVGLQAVQV